MEKHDGTNAALCRERGMKTAYDIDKTKLTTTKRRLFKSLLSKESQSSQRENCQQKVP